MLDFLKNITIDETAVEKARKSTGGGHRKQWNPAEDKLAIRVWRDGSIFPSKALVERFDLEYHSRPTAVGDDGQPEVTAEGKNPVWKHPGSALDVFSSADFPVFKSPAPLILANVVARAEGKSDVFGNIGWDEEGKPSASVLDQGATTFGKSDLLPMLKDIYGIELSEQRPYVDLVFVGKDGETAMKHFAIEKGFCFVPKKISRGIQKGETTVVRRENPWLFALVPNETLHPEQAPQAPNAPVSSSKPEPGAEPANQ